MSLIGRILGCLVLGLLVLGLGYERVLNAGARQEARPMQTASITPAPVQETAAPALKVEDAPILPPVSEAPALDGEAAIAQSEEEVIAPGEINEFDGAAEVDFIDDPVIAPEPAEVDGPSEIAAAEISEDAADDIAASDNFVIEDPVPAGPEIVQEPSLDDDLNHDPIVAEQSVERSQHVPGSRIIPDSALDGAGALIQPFEIFHRKHLTPNGALRFPYKRMPEAWILTPVEPVYPDACVNDAQPRELVTVRFRVDKHGRAYQPKAVSTANSCFRREAVRAVRLMNFRVRAAPGYLYGGSLFLVSFEFSKSSSTSG